MREKLQSLPVGELRKIAKENGIKSVTTLRKQQLVDMILEVTQRKEKEASSSEPETVEKNEAETATNSEAETVTNSEAIQSDDNNEKNIEKESGKSHPTAEYGTGEHRVRRRVVHKSKEEQIEHKDEIPNEQGKMRTGILEVMPDGFGFIRCDNFLPGDDDVYVAPSQIKRFRLKTGDYVTGRVREKRENEKFGALYYLEKVNDEPLDKVMNRPNFEDLTPIFPNERLHLETDGHSTAMRVVDLVSPIGKDKEEW